MIYFIQKKPRVMISSRGRLRDTRGFSLIEIVLVVALIASVLAILVPNLGMQRETNIANRLGRLTGDIRSAFDLAVLTRKPYRMAFDFFSGKYWLESTNHPNFTLGSLPPGRDLSVKEEKELNEEFEEDFAKYQDLMGDDIQDPDSDDKIPLKSPVIKAKKRLMWPKWDRVTDSEWSARDLAPELVIRAFQSEHHAEAVSIDEGEADEAFAYLYFFPSGYVEKAYMHIYERAGDTIDEDKTPYTLLTRPYRGEALVKDGLIEVDLKDSKEFVD